MRFVSLLLVPAIIGALGCTREKSLQEKAENLLHRAAQEKDPEKRGVLLAELNQSGYIPARVKFNNVNGGIYMDTLLKQQAYDRERAAQVRASLPLVSQIEASAAALMLTLGWKMAPRYHRSYRWGDDTLHVFSSPRTPTNLYACRIIDTEVVWRVESSPTQPSPGRWRQHPLDERIYYVFAGDGVTITAHYPDGETISRTYPTRHFRRSVGAR